MLNFTVKNLLNACQNAIKHIEIYKIREDAIIAYDPEEDTQLIYSGDYMGEIDTDTLNAEVQDFYYANAQININI